MLYGARCAVRMQARERNLRRVFLACVAASDHRE